MGEEFSIDNILDSEQIENLFTDDNPVDDGLDNDNDINNKDNPDNKSDKDTTEVDVNTLFTDEPESVGSEDNKDTEDTIPEGDGSSPKNNFYSSIAKALREEGIFQDLTDDDLKGIKKSDDFANAVEKVIQAKFDERQKRIDDALNANLDVSDIRKYENTINYLDSITDDAINDESDKGENLRKQLIYQDFINRGYSKERATREVQKSLNAGTDIDDAKEALESNKEFFSDEYDRLINDAKQEEETRIKNQKQKIEDLKQSILKDDKVFGELQVDKSIRQKVIDNISKPVYKDPKTGISYTALQKYQLDNDIDFLKNFGLVFTLTDGFKNLDGLVKNKVRKEVKKGLRELENVITNTRTPIDNNLTYVSSVSDDEDSNSIFSNGWSLDV